MEVAADKVQNISIPDIAGNKGLHTYASVLVRVEGGVGYGVTLRYVKGQLSKQEGVL